MTNFVAMIRSGWALVPIPPGQKGPTTLGWNTRERCVTAEDQLQMLEGINVGLAHAYCTPTPTCAIDVDNYKPAKAWLATHSIDLNALLLAQDAVVIWSGKLYSLKLLYRLPECTPPFVSKKINGEDGKSILEFRCATKDGKTVQDVLPPSFHPDGHQYRWLSEGDPIQLPVLPKELTNLWKALSPNTHRDPYRQKSQCHATTPPPETPRQVAIVEDLLSRIDADCDYEKWRNCVWAVLGTGWDCAQELAYDWSKSAPDRFCEEAFWTVVNSYESDREDPITVGTLYHYARLGVAV
jgi:hypothetical protein